MASSVETRGQSVDWPFVSSCMQIQSNEMFNAQRASVDHNLFLTRTKCRE